MTLPLPSACVKLMNTSSGVSPAFCFCLYSKQYCGFFANYLRLFASLNGIGIPPEHALSHFPEYLMPDHELGKSMHTKRLLKMVRNIL